jgi:hypothetical protein
MVTFKKKQLHDSVEQSDNALRAAQSDHNPAFGSVPNSYKCKK